MLDIKKRYVIDENNKKLAVEIDIDTFNKIENIMEDFALGKLMDDTKDNESLDFDEANEFYNSLKKNAD